MTEQQLNQRITDLYYTENAKKFNEAVRELIRECAEETSTTNDQEKMAALLKQVPEMQKLAKALWGEKWPPPPTGKGMKVAGGSGPTLRWQYYLREAVIAEDPNKYLEESI